MLVTKMIKIVTNIDVTIIFNISTFARSVADEKKKKNTQ